MSIGVIGQGFVGGSLTTVFSERGETVYVFDKSGKVAPGGIDCFRRDLTRNVITPKSIKEFVRECDGTSGFSGVFFVCVPTPMYEDGSADTSIVEEVLSDLADTQYTADSPERIAVIKSTVPPGSTEKWNKMFGDRGLHVVFNPEFLTEANAVNDMREQNRIVLGGPRPHINTVRNVFQRAFPKVPIIKTSSATAEMVKYVTNCMLAVKVSFANEVAQICEALDADGLNIDYDKVVEYAKVDRRLGDSHWSVPGPVPTNDGRYVRGFGGHCVTGETIVRMSDDKPMKISELYERFKEGNSLEVMSCDSKFTENNRKRVLDAVKNDYEGEMITILFEGKEFHCTADHLIPVEREGNITLCRAADIRVDDSIFTNSKQEAVSLV
jgi:UDPglucose 6-dehydrogenase